MTLRFLLPPSVGAARARARGELLELALTSELGEPVAVAVADDYAALARGALDGSAELVWAPAAVCAQLEASACAILKVVRNGRSTYRSALVARRDDGLSLSSLDGKRAAWVDPLSLGGYLLVARHLRERGINPAHTFSERAFLGTHPAALAAVLEGRADVAAVSVPGPFDHDVEEALVLHSGRAGARALCALAVTDAAPTDALVLTHALPAARADALLARVFAKSEASRRTSSLCLAMEAERFERAAPGEYAALRDLLP